MRSRIRIITAAALAAVGATVLAGCSLDDSETVRVMAAASLVDVMKPLVAQYESDHDGVKVLVDTAGSSELVRRLDSGAHADVLVTADRKTMRVAHDKGLAGEAAVAATNRLVIVVPKGNPAGVRGVDFFTVPGHRAVICASEVPCGAAADSAIEANGGRPEPISRSADVRAALMAVTSGEADAAMVYATDAVSAGEQVETIDIPDAPVNEYPVVALTGQGREFTDLLLSDRGREIFRRAGFGAP